MIDAVAFERHFLEHLAPTWRALDPALRGSFFVKRGLGDRAAELGVDAAEETTGPPPARTLTLVAAFGDLKRARLTGRRCVLAEHGAGQSYRGVTSGSYVGAPDRAGVVAVLVPNHAAAERHTEAHPTIPAHVVGCPKLDRWLGHRPPAHDAPVVAMSFHWNCRLVNETRNAFAHYRRQLSAVADRFPGALGHGHPRFLDTIIARQYQRAGLEVVRDFDDVLDRADVYVCDNSSTMFEFAATDRPVVVLNAPHYRRSVHHGGRFWDWAEVGIQVDRPDQLVDAIDQALADPPELAARRAELTKTIYDPLDGTAATTAATALAEVHDRWGTP